MRKLLIVDGSALLFQSYFGMPRKIKNKNGQYVEAVICFLGILLKTIKSIQPNELIIVFDGENKLERQEVDAEYKNNRVDYSINEDNPFAQLEIIQRVLTYLNYRWIETNNCEADDLIASIVNDYSQTYEIVISSSDKDFYQLIDNNVSVFTYRGKISKLWTNEEIINKYGFEAKFFSTLKSLMGDSSDNIKGIKGVGLITATKLIKSFGDLFDIYKNIGKIDKRIVELLIVNKQKVEQNYQIIELHSKKGLYTLPNCNFELLNKSSTAILKDFGIL